MISHNDYLNDIAGCKFHPPLDMDTINQVSISLSLPLELVEFYKQTNGLESESINILPIHDPKNPKYSWDSIGWANDPSTTKFSLDGELLKDFVIFAQLEGGASLVKGVR